MRRTAPKFDLLVIAMFLLYGQTSRAAYFHPLECSGTIDRPGNFIYREDGPQDNSRYCYSIIKAPHDRNIEVTIQPISVPCGGNPTLAFIDGLNLNEDFFPTERGPSSSEPMSMVCSSSSSYSRFTSSQNVASILMHSWHPGRGFRLRIRFVRNPRPCNIIALSTNETGQAVLSNYGQRRNCTLLVLYPVEFFILSAHIAKGQAPCPKSNDYYEIRSGSSINPFRQTFSATDSCALAAGRRLSGRTGPITARCACFASFVRLVSSGDVNNSLFLRHKPLDPSIADQCPE